MGKQDIIQVLTPDHFKEATFLDEDATIGDLLTAMAIDSETYSDGHWAFVEVAMPRQTTLSYRELFALDQGALSFDTPIKEIQERHQELLKNPDATVLKIVNLQYTLPVVFRHVPTVPEAHCRQIHILPTMNVRQILDIVTREMGLKALDNADNNSNSGAARIPTSADFVFSQVKVNADGIEEERQLTDEESPYELLKENRELLLMHQIKDYHFLFTVPDSWISKVESVTSRITKGWTATRPLSMAVYGLFGGSPASPTPPSREISAPIPIAPTSIHHPSFQNMGGVNDSDHGTDASSRKAQNRRQSMIAGSRLSSFFDPSSIGGWLAPDPKKRFSMIGGVSSPSLISRPTAFESGAGSEVHNMSDEELNETFVALLHDLNIKDIDAMMQFSREKRIALIGSNQQLQMQKEQKERIVSPDPYSIQQGSNSISAAATASRNAISRNRFIGSISSRVSFIEPDTPSPQPPAAGSNPSSNRLHSRYSSWSSLAGSYDGSDGSPPKQTTAGSERPMSPTMAAAGSLWSSWFGAAQQNDTSSIDEPNDDSPQYYVDQLMNKTTTQKNLVKQLQALRVALATAKLSWIRQFLDSRGFRALETVLDRTTIKKRAGKANDLDETLQSECVQCLRVLMNTEPGFAQVLRSPSLVAHISYCLYTSNSKLRTKVAEVLAALCVMSPESHRLVLMALSDFRVAHEERFRFEYLVQSLGTATVSEQDPTAGEPQESFEWEYKTACLSLMNALANSPSLLTDRISLRNELRRRGLEDVFKTLQAQSPPESLLIQINVYEDEQHEDWVDLQEQRAYESSLIQQSEGEKASEESELTKTITGLGPVEDEMYPRIVKTLQQYANAAVSTLTQEESDDDDENHEHQDLISRQSPQFKEDLWTIVEKFSERVFQMRNLEKDWAICQDEFLEGIQHIVGKRGAILAFSAASADPNTGGANANSSSAASVSSLSLMSSRRHSYIDYEIDSLRQDVDDLRDDNEKLRKDLELARNETEESRAQLQQQLVLYQQLQQQTKSKSPIRDVRDGSDSEPPTSYGKRENHAGVVQRLVQKEKEVAQLRETIDKMEKKYKDKAELVTDDEPRKSERSKEIDSTRWNAMMNEVQILKNKTVEQASLADERQKEIAYLKRALQIVCTRYENAMGERLTVMTEDDQTNQNSQQTEGSLQLSKTFEALARKDEEIIELRDEVDRLRKETVVGLTPTEEVLNLRGNLKDVSQRVQELQTLVAEREKTIKGLKESLFILEAAKLADDNNGVTQAHGHQGQQQQPQQQLANGRVDRSHSRGNLKLQIRALSANGWQAEEVDEEQEEGTGTLSPSISDNNIQDLGVTSPGRQKPTGSLFSPVLSPQPGKTRVLGAGGRRPALPPPPPPPGPKHQIYAAAAAAAAATSTTTPTTSVATQVVSLTPAESVSSSASSAAPVASGPPPPPPLPPTTVTEATPMQNNSSAPPPPPPPPVVVASRGPQKFNPTPPSAPMDDPISNAVAPESTVVPVPTVLTAGSGGGPPPPPPPPPPPFIAGSLAGPSQSILKRSVSLPVPASQPVQLLSTSSAAPSTSSGGPPPPPPPPPPGLSVTFGPSILKAPAAPLPPPPPPAPPGPPGAHGAASLEGANPTLPVFLTSSRPANPLKPLSMAIPQAVKPTRPMKQLFWNKLPTGTITQTVWKDICDPSSDLGTIDLDYAEIDELFCKNQVVAASATAASEKKKAVSLFSYSRANNIAIMLSRIKLTYPDIRIALMEILDEKLSIENLKAIKQYVPSGDEIEMIREYDGDFELLGNAEKFYREIMDIPRLSERVSSMIFRRRLEIEVGELKPEMDVLRLTIDELHSSRRLKSLLKTVLLMGNHLNATSFRGNAYGFQLDALLKIRDTKGVEGVKPGSSTLLHYLAKAIQTKDPSLLKFLEEVPHLEAAARISVQTLMSSVNSLVAGMNQIREEIRVLRRIRISPPNDQFVDVMEKFADANEEGIQKIVEVGQGLEQDLKLLLMFYGEDPVTTKPEDFFGMLVSFSTQLQKSQLENETMEKRLKNQQASKNNNNIRRPNDSLISNNSTVAGPSGMSVAAIRDGHLDDAIRGLRSGLRRNRRDRPMSHLYSELSLDALQAINQNVPRAGALTHSRQSSRQQ